MTTLYGNFEELQGARCKMESTTEFWGNKEFIQKKTKPSETQTLKNSIGLTLSNRRQIQRGSQDQISVLLAL